MKKIIRDLFRQKRQSLSDDIQTAHATSVCQHLMTHPQWALWQHLAFYWPTDGELSVLNSLHAALKTHKHCYLPCLTQEGTLQFGVYHNNTPLIQNQYNLFEPQTTLFLPPHQLDAVLVPLVAFDKQGHRLGMGKGYYDKTFAFKSPDLPPLLVGVAHDCQEVKNVPVDPWDIPLDFILTEFGIHSII